ncbi:hypothetical protein [Gordonia soli]|uniref:Helix-turn-helix type 11 domain-containing protein n=1 Tax=Gordonia soli NBRC 108243 TaxID=1223545 RepID=M0QQF6_9ACTN|nr:hypothetical protein [Gordonia soli]GAC70813.1 hypothetical protein GS4_41_00610 [Gordonia soli NBRC 108243]
MNTASRDRAARRQILVGEAAARGLSAPAIAREVGTTVATVRKDLEAMGFCVPSARRGRPPKCPHGRQSGTDRWGRSRCRTCEKEAQ